MKITCPKCKADQSDQLDELGTPDDGQIIELECTECSEMFMVTFNISISCEVQCGTEDSQECRYVKHPLLDKTSHFGVWAQCIDCGDETFMSQESLYQGQ